MFFVAVRTLFTFISGAAEHLVQKSCVLEDHSPQKEQLLLELLAKMLQPLQQPVMIHLRRLWLATDGRATANSCVSQLYQKQHVKQLCQQMLHNKLNLG